MIIKITSEGVKNEKKNVAFLLYERITDDLRLLRKPRNRLHESIGADSLVTCNFYLLMVWENWQFSGNRED